jgi:hypothetical protein
LDLAGMGSIRKNESANYLMKIHFLQLHFLLSYSPPIRTLKAGQNVFTPSATILPAQICT